MTGPRAVLACTLLATLPALHAQERPLPDFDVLYKAVRQNLTRSERLGHLYAFKERRTDIHTNPFGRLGTGGTRVFEVYPSTTPQLTYRRLIERDGTRVPPQEIAQQDRDYRARVADVQRRLASRTPDETRRREEEGGLARARAQRRIDDVVDALQFKLGGRAVYKGAPAIVVTFSPKPSARPTTREGRVAQKFAGTVWIDEQALEVMHVEAKAVDDLSFGYGVVARLGEGTTATLTRRPVDGDVWLPVGLTINGRGRAALVRRLVIDYSIEWFDYRRQESTSPAPFLDAGVERESGGRP